ncbi:target of rapamycin (TOR) kinase 1 [Trypanosoma cruzi]|nr:target of rapamycin (TOR) kinase 1 [Trypanosoma cruzi]
MGGEQCGPRDPGAAEVGAENDAGGATHNLLLHARKADERGGPCGLFDGGGGDGTLVGPARLPVGRKASPQIPQIIITSAIAGLTTVTHRLWAAPSSVRIDVWIDNVRIAGSTSDVTLWEAQAPRNTDSLHATIGGIANRTLRSTPSWGCSPIMLARRHP